MTTPRRTPRPLLLLLLPLLLLAACTSDEPAPSSPGAAFYAELTFEVDQPPDDPHALPGAHSRTTLVRWWYAPDPDRWRWEIETLGTVIDQHVALTVFDGETAWGYSDASNTYQSAVYPPLPGGIIPSPSFSARLGPANLDSVDAYIEEWRSRGTDSDIQLTGNATVLGRHTQIVEIRPAWRGSSESAVAPAAGQTPQPSIQGPETSGGVVRIFIDPDRMFVMRWAVDGGSSGQSYLAEVTTLDYGTATDPAVFTFDPPPDSREVEATDDQGCRIDSGSSFGGSAGPRHSGFLSPAYIPAGYGSSSSSAETGPGCETAATTITFESTGGAYLLLQQRIRPHSLPAAVSSWQPIDGTTLDDAHSQSEDGITRLLWRHDTVVALLESNALPLEELLRIAESAQLAP